MLRAAFVAHRYLGMSVGALMLMWCLSGAVMMYVPYPSLSEPRRLAALEPIDWRACCVFPADLASRPIGDFQLEMLGGEPVLRMFPDNVRRSPTLIDLHDGRELSGLSLREAQAAAAAIGRRLGFAGAPIEDGRVIHDQWTVDGSPWGDDPLFRFAWRDSAKSVLYISSRTGAAVQLTTVRQRFWNWLGAIPHWIYFAPLREHPWLWAQAIIWSAILGSFLTLTGLYLGWLQFWRLRTPGRLSPYRGFFFWHHVPGLVFGAFALSWVLSGLVSMNPWGFLEEKSPGPERLLLQGARMTGAQLQAAISNLRTRTFESPRTIEFSIVSVQPAPLAGAPMLSLLGAGGQRMRVDASGRPSPLRAEDLSFIAATLGQRTPWSASQLLVSGDSYYFAHHSDEVVLPVYRVVSGDAPHARYYIDPSSGVLLRKIGANSRAYRWLHEALHRWDFVQSRPLWDLGMLALLAGVAFLCATGTYLGLRRWLRSPHPREQNAHP